MVHALLANTLNDNALATLMTKQVLTVYEGWSVKRLAGFFVKHSISGAPVIAADDELVGVVTQSDVMAFESRTQTEDELKKLVRFYCGPFGGELSDKDLRHLQEKAIEHCTVNAIMTPEVLAVDIETSVLDACAVIVNQHIHRLFITEHGKLVGVITARDILQRLL
ncbi:CBS domain-containing protein [Teredinibacter purpureus]|jgi:Predicted transcriptional regulator, contains C-terminal CBS domains|uniref:CBS domain-containing protein n=1 Tax=Teredinibacter purpureus TaxID=2731756 RepID=UPI0005F7D431|nr:CBS domain-containing protein [Teredinibacter purpureus]